MTTITKKSHGPLHHISVLAGSSYKRLSDGLPAIFARSSPTLFGVQFDIISSSPDSACSVSYSSGLRNIYTRFGVSRIVTGMNGVVELTDDALEISDKEIDAWHTAMAEEYELLSSIVEVPISVRCSL